jgi:hypothetical protein
MGKRHTTAEEIRWRFQAQRARMRRRESLKKPRRRVSIHGNPSKLALQHHRHVGRIFQVSKHKLKIVSISPEMTTVWYKYDGSSVSLPMSIEDFEKLVGERVR